jgi:hypothetical protein
MECKGKWVSKAGEEADETNVSILTTISHQELLLTERYMEYEENARQIAIAKPRQ